MEKSLKEIQLKQTQTLVSPTKESSVPSNFEILTTLDQIPDVVATCPILRGLYDQLKKTTSPSPPPSVPPPVVAVAVDCNANPAKELQPQETSL